MLSRDPSRAQNRSSRPGSRCRHVRTRMLRRLDDGLKNSKSNTCTNVGGLTFSRCPHAPLVGVAIFESSKSLACHAIDFVVVHVVVVIRMFQGPCARLLGGCGWLWESVLYRTLSYFICTLSSRTSDFICTRSVRDLYFICTRSVLYRRVHRTLSPRTSD